jgi:hypothetical protein
VVKNPGLLPGAKSLKEGDVGKRKKDIYAIIRGCWRSCIEAGDGMDDSEFDEENAAKFRPFVANAIIANPPGFAHVHCAEVRIPYATTKFRPQKESTPVWLDAITRPVIILMGLTLASTFRWNFISTARGVHLLPV